MERAIGRSLTTAEAMGNDGGDSRRPLVDHQPTVDDPPNIFATPVAPEFPESSTIDPQATSETHLPQLALTIPSSDFLANVGENPFSTPTTPLITENEAHEDVLVREEPTLTLKSSLKNNKSKSRSRVSIVEDPAIGAFKVSEDAPPLPTPALSVAPAMDFAYVNPLFAGSTTTPLKGTPKSSTVSKPKSVKKGAGPRRMSLGAALCIPPPPRIDSNMNFAKVMQLSLGAIGIVFGDIGVSPIFFFKAVFSEVVHKKLVSGVALTGSDVSSVRVYGTLSFLLWVITLTCCMKYVIFVLYADKNGEGGTWALVSLLPTEHEESRLWKYRHEITMLGMLAASFLLADGIIGPPIGVLSAFEGLRHYSSAIPESAVVGISVGVLFVLIFTQRYGTSKMLRFYGPIMVTWFCSIAAIGLYNISKFPTIFYAISPHHYIRLVTQDPSFGLRVASEVVLAITGVESMYADLGHFKALPIRTAFFCVVYPSLVLNYLGQGAMLLSDPQAAIHPFFASVPDQVKWVVLVLATLSAVIASQANMSGCFILIDQAISLRVFPNVRTIHVDAESAGAVYIPSFNNFMLFASISLILIFRDSESLSGIYGVGITFTMICTTTFYVLAMKYTWGYADWQTGLFSIFLIIDVFLAGASVMKFANFGWISICIGLVFFAIMYTWYTTTVEIQEGLRNKLLEMSELRSHVKTVHRTKGTVVFVSNTDEDVPNVLRICAEQLRSLPENIVCMSAISSHAPFIADEERTVFRTIDAATGIYRLVISYGYAERSINTVTAIERARKRGLRINPEDRVTFVVGREIVAADVETLWYKKLRITAYLSIASNTEGKIEYYNLPPADTLEIGSQMVIGKAEIEEEDEDDYTE